MHGIVAAAGDSRTNNHSLNQLRHLFLQSNKLYSVKSYLEQRFCEIRENCLCVN